MSKEEPLYKIENVVAHATSRTSIDLKYIVRMFPDVEYRPEQFPGLVFRLGKPKTTTLIFESGKMICTGATSKHDAIEAVYLVAEELKDKGIYIPEPEVKIVNIVAAGRLPYEVDLTEVYYYLGEHTYLAPDSSKPYEVKGVMYEPEQFPGMIIRMRDPKVVFLLFASGRIVCTGAKGEEDVVRAINKLNELLKSLYLE